MKTILLLSGFFLWSLTLEAQQNAITEGGERVILYNDGTWVYLNRDSLANDNIPLNPEKFYTGSNSSLLLKSDRINIGCYIDPKKWSIKKAEDNDAAEFEINNTELGLYGLMITEKLDLPLESLANIALDNARDVAPDVRVIQKEYRFVNGLKVMMMHMTGTIQNIKFSYYGYYYSTPKGATQFIVYSSQDMIDQNVAEIEELLNGLIEIRE